MKIRREKQSTGPWGKLVYQIWEEGLGGELVCLASRDQNEHFVAYQDEPAWRFKTDFKSLNHRVLPTKETTWVCSGCSSLRGRHGLVDELEDELKMQKQIATEIAASHPPEDTFDDPLPEFRILSDVISRKEEQ